jgi:hypothetical protein
VCAEFRAQAALEEALDLPRTPYMQNLDSRRARDELQAGFCDYVLTPLWRALADVHTSLAPRLTCLLENAARYRGHPPPPPAPAPAPITPASVRGALPVAAVGAHGDADDASDASGFDSDGTDDGDDDDDGGDDNDNAAPSGPAGEGGAAPANASSAARAE